MSAWNLREGPAAPIGRSGSARRIAQRGPGRRPGWIASLTHEGARGSAVVAPGRVARSGRPAAGAQSASAWPEPDRGSARTLDRRLSVAPMMDWTDRHCRYFHRLLAAGARCSTPRWCTPAPSCTATCRAICASIRPSIRWRCSSAAASPAELARAARDRRRAGLRRDQPQLRLPVAIGCSAARFGACLMARAGSWWPTAWRRCAPRSPVPVTVKCRIGIDDSEELRRSCATSSPRSPAAGCGTFIVHARKAWLQGLSPKENREMPPLRYEWSHRLKREFPGAEDRAQWRPRARPRHRQRAAARRSTA